MAAASPPQRSAPTGLTCSVVLCTYNGVRYLDEQIASLVSQDRPPDEIVISDDHSTDGTWEKAQRFEHESELPVVVRRNPENVGFVRNFSEAIDLATGRIIFLCDQDDIWLPGKIGAYERAFMENPEVAMVFSDAAIIDESGNQTGQTAWASDIVAFTPAERRAWVSKHGASVERLIRRNVVTGSAMAFRSRYRPLLLPIPSWADHGVPHDAWIALLLAAVAPTIPLPQVYSLYRLHPDQRLGLNAPEARRRGQHDLVLSRARSQLLLSAQRLELCQDQFDMERDGLTVIQAKVQHLSERLRLHGSPLRRFGPVWRELRSGRYAKFSSGYRSAFLDLLPWTRELTAPSQRQLH